MRVEILWQREWNERGALFNCMQKKVTFERKHAAFSWQRSATNVVNGSPASLASRLIIEQYNKRDQKEIKRQMSLLPCNHYYKVRLSEWRISKFTLRNFGRLTSRARCWIFFPTLVASVSFIYWQQSSRTSQFYRRSVLYYIPVSYCSLHVLRRERGVRRFTSHSSHVL